MDVTFTNYEQLAGIKEGIVASVSERFKYDRETGKRTEQYEGAMIVTVSPVKGYEQIRTLVPGKPVTLTAESIEAAYKRGKVYKARFSGFSARFYATAPTGSPCHPPPRTWSSGRPTSSSRKGWASLT